MNKLHTFPRLLVVEDHAVFRAFLKSWLSRRYRVTAVRDGIEGLAQLGAGLEVDLILLDLETPRLSGLRFLQNLRSSGAFNRIPVITLSSNTDPVVADRCRALGISAAFGKPYSPEGLIAAIERTVTGALVHAN